uniref:MHC class I-like antigen recognition-like domain-containing protein n=1 Tax=Astyanax mexicanus TaxID=7994 RepID=A0A8B9I0V8_ASTMX
MDDREIDYYNSKEQKKIPKQSWMMEKMQEDYWEKGTQSRKSKEQWFKVNLEILMQRMNHSNQDLHVLQWRTGCEIILPTTLLDSMCSIPVCCLLCMTLTFLLIIKILKTFSFVFFSSVK